MGVTAYRITSDFKGVFSDPPPFRRRGMDPFSGNYVGGMEEEAKEVFHGASGGDDGGVVVVGGGFVVFSFFGLEGGGNNVGNIRGVVVNQFSTKFL